MPADPESRARTRREDEARSSAHRPSPREEPAPSDRKPLRAAALYEVVSSEGRDELSHSSGTIWWSGLAAGLSIGFSFVAQGAIAAHLGEERRTALITGLGYPVGFLIVILGRQPLLEATLTAILPVIRRHSRRWLLLMLRLWGLVLAANLAGSVLFAALLAFTGLLTEPVMRAIVDLGHHMMLASPWQMFLKAVAAGWLIAALIWILPAVEGEEFIVVAFVTYLIAIAEFTHIGPALPLAITMLLGGQIGLADFSFGFFLPTLFGNLLGGVALFLILALEQGRSRD